MPLRLRQVSKAEKKAAERRGEARTYRFMPGGSPEETDGRTGQAQKQNRYTSGLGRTHGFKSAIVVMHTCTWTTCCSLLMDTCICTNFRSPQNRFEELMHRLCSCQPYNEPQRRPPWLVMIVVLVLFRDTVVKNSNLAGFCDHYVLLCFSLVLRLRRLLRRRLLPLLRLLLLMLLLLLLLFLLLLPVLLLLLLLPLPQLATCF